MSILYAVNCDHCATLDSWSRGQIELRQSRRIVTVLSTDFDKSPRSPKLIVSTMSPPTSDDRTKLIRQRPWDVHRPVTDRLVWLARRRRHGSCRWWARLQSPAMGVLELVVVVADDTIVPPSRPAAVPAQSCQRS